MGLAAGHRRAPRAERRARAGSSRPLITVRATAHRTTNSPACQASSSLLVVSTRLRCPEAGSMFCDSAVRVLLWKGTGMAGPANEVGRDVFMPASSIFFASRR